MPQKPEPPLSCCCTSRRLQWIRCDSPALSPAPARPARLPRPAPVHREGGRRCNSISFHFSAAPGGQGRWGRTHAPLSSAPFNYSGLGGPPAVSLPAPEKWGGGKGRAQGARGRLEGAQGVSGPSPGPGPSSQQQERASDPGLGGLGVQGLEGTRRRKWVSKAAWTSGDLRSPARVEVEAGRTPRSLGEDLRGFPSTRLVGGRATSGLTGYPAPSPPSEPCLPRLSLWHREAFWVLGGNVPPSSFFGPTLFPRNPWTKSDSPST